MDLKLPEETLMKLGFKTLDLMYGKLTIKKGAHWDELFVDKDGEHRLGYDKPTSESHGLLGYYYKDKDFFLSIIPLEKVDYLRVLMSWVEERYKRKVDITLGRTMAAIR